MRFKFQHQKDVYTVQLIRKHYGLFLSIFFLIWKFVVTASSFSLSYSFSPKSAFIPPHLSSIQPALACLPLFFKCF